MRRVEIDNREIFQKRQESSGYANAFVVAKTGAAEGQKIAFENYLAVDGGVRLADEKKNRQRRADQRDVQTAAGKAEPRRIVFPRDQVIDGDGEKKCAGGQAEADEPLVRLDGKEQGIYDRDQEQQSSQREA